MRIAATLTALLAVALVTVGVMAESNPEALESVDAHGVEAELVEAGNETVVFFDHAFQATSAAAHTVTVEVPENATLVTVAVSAEATAASGVLSWTGLDDCDGSVEGGTVATGAVTTGEAECVLEAGARDVTFTLERGVSDVAVVLTAFL